MKKAFSFLICLSLIFSLFAPVVLIGSASSRVDNIISNMTLREKITQMLMVDFRYWDENTNDSTAKTGLTVMNDQVREIVKDYDFGAIIYFAQNLIGTEQSFNLTLEMQKAATADNGIPMLVCADQEGGSVYRLATGTALPGNMALGAASDTEYAKAAGQIIGSELSALGINTTLSPVVDVNNNPNNPVIGLRSYSDDAVTVGNLASAVIDGLKENNVIGCAKHFPGHGDTATDSHYGLPSVNKALSVLKECELKPYEIAINKGIDMIMTAHILYPQLETDTIVSSKTGSAESLPATMSDDIITELLKKDMGFDGIVVTDAMNMAGITNNWTQVQSIVLSISAGVDMICMPCTLDDKSDLSTLETIISGVQSAVNNGTIPIDRINDAVTRILTVKEKRGILDWNEDDYSAEYANFVVGSEINRQSEREIAAAAVTVVQNTNNTLPLNIESDTSVLMFVPNDNEKAQMIMGWNRAKAAGLIPDGATVNVLTFSSSTVSSSQKTSIKNADIVIINSEVSSASKMNGKTYVSAFPMAAVTYAESLGKTTVVQSVDKPYDIQSYSNADAVLAVYGCKGSSVDVTEALVGGVTSSANAYGPNIIAGIEVMLGVFSARGTLPLDVPVFSGNSYTNTIKYARGSGITYNAKHIHDTCFVNSYHSPRSIVFNTDFYECRGCGMWFEDKEATIPIKNKFDIIVENLPEAENSSNEDLNSDGIPDKYEAYIDSDGNCVFGNSYGYEFEIDYVNGVIKGEDATIITSSTYYSSCNPNWAISVQLRPTEKENVYSVVKVVVTPKSAANAGLVWEDGDIVMVVHSQSSKPNLYENWMSKVAAVALKEGDILTVSTDKTKVTVNEIITPPENVNGIIDGNIIYNLDTVSGVFELSGVGTLPQFTDNSPSPWSEYSDYINTVKLSSDFVSLSALSFKNCKYIENVFVPSFDTQLNDYAFKDSVIKNIYCHEGSSAKEFALNNSYDYTLFGDLDRDKDLDISDIVIYRKALLFEKTPEAVISDINFDNSFDILDLISAKKYLAAIS